MSKFPSYVQLEIEEDRNKFDPIGNLHEGYAVLLEEVDELWDEVRKQPSVRRKSDVMSELVQIAAMAQRIAEDLEYVT